MPPFSKKIPAPLQRIIDKLYRYPKSRLLKIRKQGGWWNSHLIERERRAMERASERLFVPYEEAGAPLEVHFLTGRHYWYQTVFCMYSLQKAAGRSFRWHLYDDGTFDEALIARMKAQAPGAVVHTRQEIEARLRVCLPEQDYPFLWRKRRVYPHLKKLTDIHAGSQGWKLVLDSDMLFYKNPDLLIKWLSSPQQTFHILDIINSYGYPINLMEKISGNPIQEKVNVGAVGIKSEEINWKLLDQWGKELEEKKGASYFLEQALTAMLIGQNSCTIGPSNEYIVMPSKEQVLLNMGTMHHYVDSSKEWYFKISWKQVCPNESCS